MIFKSGVLANFTAGYKLRRKMLLRAVNNQIAINKMVNVVTTGDGTKIIKVIITPSEIPTTQLESSTIKL